MKDKTRRTENLPRSTGPRKRRKPCGADLTQVQTSTACPSLVAATELLLEDEHHSDQDWMLAGLPATRSEARDALVLLTLDALAIKEREPRTVDAVATALEHAYEVLHEPGPDHRRVLADHYHLLDAGGPFAAIGPTQALRITLHPVACHPFTQSGIIFRRTQLAFRIGSDWPRTPNALRHRHTPTPTYCEDWRLPPAPLSTIPQLYWEDGLPGIGSVTSERSRFALSIAIASVGRNITTASAAEQLGAPKVQAARVAHDWAKLSDQCGWPALRQAIVTAATQLTREPGTIDYRRRQKELATIADLDARFPDSGWTDAERLWLWVMFTQSSARFTPEAWGDLRFPAIVPERPSEGEDNDGDVRELLAGTRARPNKPP